MTDKMVSPINDLDALLQDQITEFDRARDQLDWEIATWLNRHPIFNDPRMNIPFYKDDQYNISGITEMWNQSPDPTDTDTTSTWIYVKGKYITHTYACPIVDGVKTKEHARFPSLHTWFDIQPFKHIKMIVMNFCHAGQASVRHCDYADLSNTNVVSKYFSQDTYAKNDYLLWHSHGSRRFYVIDGNGNKIYKPACRVCTFDQVLDHGVDPLDYFNFSIKIGGEYTDEFRELYDAHTANSSSTA